MNHLMRTSLTCLVVTLTACGAPSLAGIQGKTPHLELTLAGNGQGFDQVWFRLLTDDTTSCAPVEERAQLNGLTIEQIETGGGKPAVSGSVLPTVACFPPEWSMYTGEVLVPHGDALSLTFESPGFGVTLAPVAASPRVERTRVTAGSPLRVHASAPWLGVSLEDESTTPGRARDEVAVEVAPGLWELPTPSVPGHYRVRIAGNGRSSEATCEGFSSCTVNFQLEAFVEVELITN